MANLCCPIELEPKTLNEGQISQAREVAAEIVFNNELKESHETTNLLIQGVREAIAAKEVITKDKQVEDLLCNEEKNATKSSSILTVCQCSCPTPQMESPIYQSNKLNEPLSAPF